MMALKEFFICMIKILKNGMTFYFNCQEPGFTPIGTYNGKIVVSGSKFSPNGELIEYNDTNAIYFYDHTTKTFQKSYTRMEDMTLAG